MDNLVLLITNPNQSFVRTEIATFALLVKKLFVISITHETSEYKLPSNVEFHKFSTLDYKKENKISHLIPVFLNDFFGQITNIPYLKKSREHVSFLRQAVCLKTQLISFYEKHKLIETTPILSFWCDIWALSLALLKADNSHVNVCTRLHGRDLYEDRQPTTTFAIPFRRYVVNHLDKLLPISIHGATYLKQKYPKVIEKIVVNYLGCPDLGECKEVNEVFTIISIATIRHVKRIHRIAEVVKAFPKPIKWIHIGGEANRKKDNTIAYTEQLMNEINELPDKEVNMLGHVNPEKVSQVAHQYKPHVLVNASEYEGLPVSVMEALSMGIPCVATNVGGTSELVTSSFLIDENFTNEDLTKKLLYVYDCYQANWKTQARKLWEKELNPTILKKQLLRILKA
jgi:glycosyltransferase involved in cell wall biosynthesis